MSEPSSSGSDSSSSSSSSSSSDFGSPSPTPPAPDTPSPAPTPPSEPLPSAPSDPTAPPPYADGPPFTTPTSPPPTFGHYNRPPAGHGPPVPPIPPAPGQLPAPGQFPAPGYPQAGAPRYGYPQPGYPPQPSPGYAYGSPYPMTPPPPRKKGKGWIIGGAIAAVVLLLCCGCIGLAIWGFREVDSSMRDEARDAVDDHLSALQNENYDAAYDLLCQDQQDRYRGPSEYAEAMAAEPPIESYDIGDIEFASSGSADYEVDVELRIQGRTSSQTVDVIVGDDGGDALVCSEVR